MKKPFARLFVDVSYTRDQPGSIGITRTARCLADRFMRLGQQRGRACRPVVGHSRGYRQLPTPRMAPAAADADGLKQGRASSRLPRWTFDALSQALTPVAFRSRDLLFLPVCHSRAIQAELEDYARGRRLTLPPTGNFRLGADLVRTVRAADGAYMGRPLADFQRSNVPLFAAAGSFEPRKNFVWPVQVFEAFWATRHEARLLIMGRPTVDVRGLIDGLLRHRELGRRLLTVLDGADEELAAVCGRARALVSPLWPKDSDCRWWRRARAAAS